MAEIVNPHEVDEDPEECVGKLIKDPWNDDSQDDWASGPLEDGTEQEEY